MTTTDQAAASSNQSTGSEPKTRWFSPRRKRFWIVLVLVLYALLGFFAAPKIIRNQLTALLQDDLGRPTSIEKIAVNPFYLSLSVRGFELEDTDGVKLAAFDELYINFQFLSLLKWAWTFSDIRLAEPYFYFERFDSNDSRLDRLLADFAKARPAEPKTDVDTSNDVPRVLIRKLVLSEGHVDARDNLPETPVEMQLSPINISIQELNTLPGLHGQQSVTIHLPDDASVKWSGSLALAPLDTRGELVLERLRLNQVIAYLEAILPLESISATLSSHFQYHLRQDNNGDFELDINELDLTLNDIAVTGLEPATEFIDITGISLSDGKLRYPVQSLHFGKLAISEPRVSAWINEDGTISVLDLVPETGDQPESSDTGKPGLPWKLGIAEFVLKDGSLALSDRSTQPNAAVNLTQLQVNAAEISNEEGAQIPVELSGELTEGGSYSVSGSLGVLPELSMSVNAATNGIPLALGQPYIQQFAQVLVEDGVIDSMIDVKLPAGQAYSIGGSIEVPGLKINDELKNETLLSWNMLDIDHFDLDPDTLHLSSLTLEGMYGRFVINEDMSTNLTGLVVEQTTDTGADATTETDKQSMDIIVGGINVDNGSLDFSDFSLPLPFATHIEPLNGTISTIATNSTEPANIRLEGQVDEYGLARFEGGMDMFDPIRYTDVSVDFRNLEMSSLSPYTVQFAGREIDEGKLDLGLVYSIEDGQLHGANEIVMSDLVLGEKVDHPDAASLPLGLAVSLLKDANGVIDIDLPVEGDVNDPEFKIGGVIWQAFTGIITKIVSAPFKLLGKLIGIDSEDFGQFEFLAGRADLTPPEMEKIVQLEEALQQRPELVIEISGVTDHAIDAPALKSIKFRAIASERLGEGLDDKDDEDLMLDERIRGVVEALFSERFPDVTPQSLKAAHTAPPADDPEGTPLLDELAYATDLWNRLLASEVISDQALTGLAMARAEAIQAAFLANGQVDESRIVITEPSEVESDDGEWVKLELGVASD